MKKITPIRDIKTFFKANNLSFKMWVLLVILLCLGAYLGVTFARYVFTSVRNGYFNSNSFYFNSDKMGEDTAVYQLNNWSGADTYSIVFNMNSMDNNNLKSNSDISYNITYSCSSNILCSASKNSGVIYSSTNMDSFTVVLTPNATFVDGDEATFNITASATAPYKKTLSARFTLKVGKAGLTYKIDDEANRPYLDLRITNTLDFYEVRTAFDSYVVGDRLDPVTYGALSASNKEKCTSAIITVSFDPNDVILDMTSPAYLKGYDFSNMTALGVSYINHMSFKMEALSSELIRFYKQDVSQNYTYPIVNANSVITVTYD